MQAPMAGVQDSELALAVSSAGGLGSLPCGMLSAEQLEAELKHIQSKTDRPINLNFFCHTPPQPEPEVEAKWRKLLAPYYEEFEIDPADIPQKASRQPFSHSIADVLESLNIRVVSFHYGLPEKNLLDRVKKMGATVLSTATTVTEAEWLQAHGADAIIAQGVEAGGHRGMFLQKDVTTQLGTFALVPQIVQKVDLPVIAAGGIADATGVRAVLDLGATAAQIGTAYMLCHEAKTRMVHRAALKSDRVRHTVLTTLLSGGAARGMVNRLISELGPMHPDAPPYPLASSALAPLRAAAEAQNSGDFSPLWCGQNATGCKEISAVELTHQLMAGLD
ncbi:MAG: nitronate monooxygenase [Chloroflexota bacterium]